MKAAIIFISSLYLLSGNLQAQSQKKELDTTAFRTWQYVNDPSITGNGKYAAYVSQNGGGNPRTLIVKSTHGDWSESYGPNIRKYAFANNSKWLYILDETNTVKVYQLGTGNIINSYQATSFALFMKDGIEWLLMNVLNGSIILVNTTSQKTYRYADAKSYLQDEAKSRLLLVNKNDQLSVILLNNMKETVIGHFNGLSNLTFNSIGNKVAFLYNSEVWVANTETGKSEQLINRATEGIDTALYLSGINKFSSDGKQLFVYLTEKYVKPEFEQGAVKVRVWNYQDARLRTDPGKTYIQQSFLSMIDLQSRKIIKIQEPFEDCRFLNNTNTDLIAITAAKGNEYERHWNIYAKSKFYVYDCVRKKRYKLNIEPRSLSPDSKYIIGVDSLNVNYRAWNTESHQEYDLTEHIGTIANQKGVFGDDLKFWKFFGWFGDHQLMLGDENDIWQINCSNTSTSICLTKSVGRKENIQFKLLNSSFGHVFKNDEVTVVLAMDNNTKKSGYYLLAKDGKALPKKLLMSDALYGDTYIKSAFENVAVISKESVDSSRNFYITRDFIKLKALSDVYPEQSYKWLTSELVHFTTIDGKPSQAIVYKPADFDPNKKYPVIFNYYETFSKQLHNYIQPDLTSDNINVPFFVSQGYIVCKPDFIYTPQKAGESIISSIEGIAKHLAKLPYVDTAHMGIHGHSWGSYETNYIITHSKYFKAAVSTNGVSNMISAATSITGGGINFFDYSTINFHERFGKTMWEAPELYIKHSPILDADKVTTPVLIMANANDGIVNSEQGVGFFWALRRLGKPAWLLQYDGEDHVLVNERNKIDYTNKILDFFNVFLKKQPQPHWMRAAL